MRSLMLLHIMFLILALGCSYDDGYLKKLYKAVQFNPYRYEVIPKKVLYMPECRPVKVYVGPTLYFNSVNRYK